MPAEGPMPAEEPMPAAVLTTVGGSPYLLFLATRPMLAVVPRTAEVPMILRSSETGAQQHWRSLQLAVAEVDRGVLAEVECRAMKATQQR